jgi:hypothetical protein
VIGKWESEVRKADSGGVLLFMSAETEKWTLQDKHVKHPVIARVDVRCEEKRNGVNVRW